MEPSKSVHEPLNLPAFEAILSRHMLITIESQLKQFNNFTTAADPIDDIIVGMSNSFTVPSARDEMRTGNLFTRCISAFISSIRMPSQSKHTHYLKVNFDLIYSFTSHELSFLVNYSSFINTSEGVHHSPALTRDAMIIIDVEILAFVLHGCLCFN